MQSATMPAELPAGGTELSLALTLATRLCHDLAGTAGALNAALDMAVDGQEVDALPLAQDCARELVARLCLLRAAFGGGDVPTDALQLAAGLPGGDRLAVDVSRLSGGVEGADGRLVANLLFLGAQSLPRGGTIHLSGQPGWLMLEVAGPRAAWPVALARSLADPVRLAEATGEPREVGVAIVCLLAREAGLRITVESETHLRIT